MWRRSWGIAGQLARAARQAGAEGLLSCSKTSPVQAAWTGSRREFGRFSSRQQYQNFGKQTSRLSLQNPRVKVLALVVGAGGVTVFVMGQQEVPYTGRRHTILVSAASEAAMGAQAYEEVLQEAHRNGTLVPPGHPAVRHVAKIGRRIANVVAAGKGGGFQEHLRFLDWRFTVIDSPEVNAFVVPGGKVVVYSGLLNTVSSEDELAAVLAHECAHVLARHGAERMTKESILSFGQLLVYWALGIAVPSGLLIPAFFLPNSRKTESEADLIGIQLAAQACYDPGAAITVFEKLGAVEHKMGGDRIPAFLRTHPMSDQRVEDIKQELPIAERWFDASDCNSWSSGFRRAVGAGGW